MKRCLYIFSLFLILCTAFFISSCSSDLQKKAAEKIKNITIPYASVESDFEPYFDAVKKLQARVLLEQTRIIGKPSYSARQALWLKLKKQIITKELTKKALIKNDVLVVKTSDIDALSRKLVARVNDLVRPSNKKNRIISIGYAESKIRDMLRKAGYRHPEHVKTITRTVLRELKISKQIRRIPLATLEEITERAMKNFKRSAALQESISRLAAEVMFLKAIKAANLTQAKEIEAINKMTDALTKLSSREQVTHKAVKALISETLENLGQKKPLTKNKKNKKRGQKVRSGRWGKPREPRNQ